MNNDIDDAILRLGGSRNLTLRSSSGACVHVHWGRVWITREGDSKDHIVASGESLAIGRSGATVLTAINDAGVSVMERCNPVTGTQAAGAPESTAATADDDNRRAFRLERTVPSFEQIDHHLARARRLRACFVGKLLRGEWRSAYRAGNGAKNAGAGNGAKNAGAGNGAKNAGAGNGAKNAGAGNGAKNAGAGNGANHANAGNGANNTSANNAVTCCT